MRGEVAVRRGGEEVRRMKGEIGEKGDNLEAGRKRSEHSDDTEMRRGEKSRRKVSIWQRMKE